MVGMSPRKDDNDSQVLRTIYHTVEVSVKIQKLQRSGSCVMDQGKEVTKKKLNDCLEMGSLLKIRDIPFRNRFKCNCVISVEIAFDLSSSNDKKIAVVSHF